MAMQLQRPFTLSTELRTGVLYGILSAVFFGVMAFCVRLGANYAMPSTELLFARTLFALAYALPATWHELPYLFSKRSVGILWGRAVAASISVRILFYNIGQIGSANATLILLASSVFTVLLAWLFYKERVHWLEWLCMALVLAGSVLLSWPQQASTMPTVPLFNLCLGLFGAVMAAISFLSLKQASKAASQAGILLVYAIVLLFASLLPPQPQAWVWPSGTVLLLLLGVGFSSMLNQLYLTTSYSLCKTSVASMLGLSGVLWAALLEAIFLKHYPSVLQGLAMGVMLGGLLLLKSVKSREVEAKL